MIKVRNEKTGFFAECEQYSLGKNGVLLNAVCKNTGSTILFNPDEGDSFGIYTGAMDKLNKKVYVGDTVKYGSSRGRVTFVGHKYFIEVNNDIDYNTISFFEIDFSELIVLY